jgi:hypothetical protein
MPSPDLRDDPHAIRVRKRPLPVRVRFAQTDGICPTLEGAVGYQSGDAIVSGVTGEQWPVSRETFLRSYEAVPPTAEGTNGTYVSRSREALARQLESPTDVTVGWQRDRLSGAVGDWLLQYADGSHGIVKDTIFAETYELVEGGQTSE